MDFLCVFAQAAQAGQLAGQAVQTLQGPGQTGWWVIIGALLTGFGVGFRAWLAERKETTEKILESQKLASESNKESRDLYRADVKEMQSAAIAQQEKQRQTAELIADKQEALLRELHNQAINGRHSSS